MGGLISNPFAKSRFVEHKGFGGASTLCLRNLLLIIANPFGFPITLPLKGKLRGEGDSKHPRGHQAVPINSQTSQANLPLFAQPSRTSGAPAQLQ
jgi:hypothetical protein